MVCERQWNIVVELTLAGRTARYIADRLDCLISTIRRIRSETGRWQRLPGSGRPNKTTARDERYLGRLVKRIRFRSMAQDTQVFVTHLGHPVFKVTVQRRLHDQVIYRRVAAQKKRTLVSRIGSDDDDCVLELLTGQCQKTGLAYFSPIKQCILYIVYCDGWVRVWRTAREKYLPECLRMVDRNRIVSVMVWKVIGYHGVGNLVILDENVNADNYVRTLSENLLDSVENIVGDRKHAFVFQNDNDPTHTARRTVTLSEQQDIPTIQ